jgi:GNAT superfamily N-acetyltransferase
MANLSELIVRRAELDDAVAVGGLHADSWRRHYRGAYSDSFLDGDVVGDRITTWTQRLSAPTVPAATILAEDRGALVGFAHVVFDEDPEFGSLLDNLHVVHDRKRGGIGTRLMAEAARSVIQHGAGGLYLWVLEQNVDAQAFYRARGGVCVGRRLVQAPGGIADRLNGSPSGLRVVWRDPSMLLD